MNQQEAQLSQRDRAWLRVVENYAKSLKVIRNYTPFIIRECVSSYQYSIVILSCIISEIK